MEYETMMTAAFSNASNIALSVDSAMSFIVSVSVVLLLLVTFFMVFFAIRYRRANNPEAAEIEGNTLLEITWTVVPTVLVAVMFFYGYSGFKLMNSVPEDAMEVDVLARMWSWSFTYENGATSRELVLPEGAGVVLRINSKDVLHSLFIPAFRVKEDAVPGQETSLWFIPRAEGIYDLFCTEYCGRRHSKMTTVVKVLGRAEFDKWYASEGKPREDKAKEGKPAKPAPDSARGKALLDERGCLGCHSMDGTESGGPTFKGIFGRKTTVMTEGRERVLSVDADYMVRSITSPSADIVKGFPPIMPELGLSPEEAGHIAAYLLKETTSGQ